MQYRHRPWVALSSSVLMNADEHRQVMEDSPARPDGHEHLPRGTAEGGPVRRFALGALISGTVQLDCRSISGVSLPMVHR